jgi:hypothetical protein
VVVVNERLHSVPAVTSTMLFVEVMAAIVSDIVDAAPVKNGSRSLKMN